MNCFEEKSVLVTGGTGSFGKEFVSHVLRTTKSCKIVVFSRDEQKQWEMGHELNDERVQFVVGDVRDSRKISAACFGVDVLVHAAAMKIVPTAESNPAECIKTNVIGAMNVIDACFENKVGRIVALSTDKASDPACLYGATKLASDKLFVGANFVRENTGCVFSCVRFGNLIGSRGSIVRLLLKQSCSGSLTLTHPGMTRFMVKIIDAVHAVEHAAKWMIGGEIYVQKTPSMKLIDIARCVAPDVPFKWIGCRPGEKIHEQMIGPADSQRTYEFRHFYKIAPSVCSQEHANAIGSGGSLVDPNFVLTSCQNELWMSPLELGELIEKNRKQWSA